MNKKMLLEKLVGKVVWVNAGDHLIIIAPAKEEWGWWNVIEEVYEDMFLVATYSKNENEQYGSMLYSSDAVQRICHELID